MSVDLESLIRNGVNCFMSRVIIFFVLFVVVWCGFLEFELVVSRCYG